MRPQLKKKKQRNTTGRKNPAFGQLVQRIARECQVTQEELTRDQSTEDKAQTELDPLGRTRVTMDKLPEGMTVVETLNGHFVFSDSRLGKYVEIISEMLKEFKEEFWEGEFGTGSSIMDLRRDYKNRTWGDDQTILALCYMAIACDLAKWSYPRNEWKELEHGTPWIKFTGPKRNAESTGEQDVIEEQIQTTPGH